MFTGSVNADMRRVIDEIVSQWDVKDVYIGCSGNFTIENILKGKGFRMHSNDVSLYSCAVGYYLTGQSYRLEVQLPEFEWLTSYLGSNLDKLATIMLAMDMLDGYGRPEPYFVRKRKAYIAQWERLHEATKEKILKALDGVQVQDFYPGDVLEFVKAPTEPSKCGFVSFPPTYKGGYERLYRSLQELFSWDEPEYEIFDDNGLEELEEGIMGFGEWITSKDEKMENLAEYEVACVQTSLRSKPVYIYASSGKKRITAPKIQTRQLYIPRFGMNDVITPESELRVVRIEQQQMNTLRSLYLDPKIAPASALMNFAVLVDGKLIGAFAMSKGQYGIAEAYMMTDFAIEPTSYKRLSKLVLAAALSKEVKDIVEEQFKGRTYTVTTTAFTSKPVSMKYRGLFDLDSRKTNPDRLNYSAMLGRWTLKGALEWWTEKHNR